MKTDGVIKGFIVDPSKADIDNEAKQKFKNSPVHSYTIFEDGIYHFYTDRIDKMGITTDLHQTHKARREILNPVEYC